MVIAPYLVFTYWEEDQNESEIAMPTFSLDGKATTILRNSYATFPCHSYYDKEFYYESLRIYQILEKINQIIDEEDLPTLVILPKEKFKPVLNVLRKTAWDNKVALLELMENKRVGNIHVCSKLDNSNDLFEKYLLEENPDNDTFCIQPVRYYTGNRSKDDRVLSPELSEPDNFTWS